MSKTVYEVPWSIRWENFVTKWSKWEFWPMRVVHIPSVAFWLWFALRSRSLFFFSRVNTAIANGGMVGASKFDIMRLFPDHIQPPSVLVPAGTDRLALVLQRMYSNQLSWPVVAKPNIGERGFMVKKLESEQELKTYLLSMDADLIIQEFVDLPLELGVLYYRFPDDTGGHISSLCIKVPLEVIGDGASTLEELISKHPRARMQFKRLVNYLTEDLLTIPVEGERIVLEEIGNHCRGSKFIDGHQYIDQKLVDTFDGIFSEVKGVMYGRFDLRCESIDALKAGSFQFFEFNGVASEPAHIYDPNYKMSNAYRVMYQHWKVLYGISAAQARRGIAALSIRQGIDDLRDYFRYMKQTRKMASSDLGLA